MNLHAPLGRAAVISVGVDVGGTFTDFLVVDAARRRVSVTKVSSTPRDLSEGILRGLAAAGVAPGELGLVVHGTTVATNAVLERRGARVALLTTRGFRDVLEMRRRDRPRTWGLRGEFRPLVAREDRHEIGERTDARGAVLVPVDPAEVEAVVRKIRAEPDPPEALVLAFLHAYANAANERAAAAVARRLWPNDYVVCASDVLPEIREFERTSTTVVNAYVRPGMDRYLARLDGRLRDRGHAAPVLLIQSNGGLMSPAAARRLPVNTVLSGPAAGVIAAGAIARAAGFPNAISADMGGTSFDVALIPAGQPRLTQDATIDFGIPIRTPMIEIRTIGAGGGSIAWLDRGGFLRVGPHSAGAEPGPACYGRGGRAPTVTDANLILGRIGVANPIAALPGGRFDVGAAAAALEATVAGPLGLSRETAAEAVVRVANVEMAAAVRLVSVERGYDPRDFVLVAFGGAGPLHAGALLRDVGIARALVPPYPGITSAIGCLLADARYDFVHTVNRRVDDVDTAQVHQILAECLSRGQRELAVPALSVREVVPSAEADMVYEGQVHPIRVPLPALDVGREALMDAFAKAYQEKYGRLLPGIPVRLVNLRLAVTGLRDPLDLGALVPRPTGALGDARRGARGVFFDGREHATPVYDRARLPLGAELPGPAVVEQGDATTVVEPEMQAWVDDAGNLLMEPR